MKNQNRYRNTKPIGLLDDFLFRIVILALLMLTLMSVLLFRAYYLQLHHGEEHRAEIAKQSVRRIRIPGRRGTIYSADGEVLAGNRTVYDLVFYPEGMRSGNRGKRTLDVMCQTANQLAAVIGRTDVPERKTIERHLNISPGMPLTVFSDLSPEEQSAKLRDLEGFVNYVVKALVDFPEDVVVSSESVKEGKMIKIVCRPGDRGKIIGKKGKTIMALRSLVAGAAGRLQDRVMVEVMDDEEEVKA